MKLDKNYKVRVNPEQSRKIQELLFALGGCWLSGSHFKEPIMLYADYLFLNKSMVLTCASEHGNCYFENKHTHTEIQAGELIALLTDLSKSAENPPQGMELTPEFETEASEPKFKVGDKVYLFGTDYIEEITKIIGANVYLAGADFDASVSVKEICHATPENYERLQAIFPDIEFERLVVSNPDIASRSIAELNLPAQYGAIITRVRRGDLDLLARDDFTLQIGDRVAVVVPREHLDEMQELFGDSERRVSEIDALALGMGLVLGMLLGLVSFPMPGGESFSLGPAAGPLIVGMLLGALRKTGPLIWTLPEAANLTIRQLGLLLFLAGLGLTAGPKFAGVLASPMAWRAGLLALLVAAVACAGMVVGGRWIAKLSAPRTAGGVAGFLGQPAVLEAATAKVADERVESAYAALFAFSIVIKIVLVPLVWNL